MYERIPDHYSENKLVIMIRDPLCLYAYWEITPELKAMVEQHFRQPWGTITLVLRVLGDIQGVNFLSILGDTVIDKSADNWYLPLPNSSRRFRVILGFHTPDGTFVPLLGSNVVELFEPTEALHSPATTSNTSCRNNIRSILSNYPETQSPGISSSTHIKAN